MRHIKRFVSDRPWILVLVGIGLFTSLTAAFVVIAAANPPVVLQ